MAFKGGSTILCSENLCRGGCPHVKGWTLRGAPLYSVVRTFTEGGWGVLTSRVDFKRDSTIYSVARTFTEGGWGVLTSRVAFKRGSTLLCSENLYRGGCPHVKGGL